MPRDITDRARSLRKLRLEFAWSGDPDGEAIDLAFNKKRADDRKVWINRYEEGHGRKLMRLRNRFSLKCL